MNRTFFTLLNALCVMLLCLAQGCALYPAVQVVGGLKSGYDAAVFVDEMVPKDRLANDCAVPTRDDVLQRRLTERLQIRKVANAKAYVFNGHVYLLGTAESKDQARKAIAVAKSVKGIKGITSRFYTTPPPHVLTEDTHLTRLAQGRIGPVRKACNDKLQVVVVTKNAVVMGVAPSEQTKLKALQAALATPGVNHVVDYVQVAQVGG